MGDILPANHVLLRTLGDIFPANHVLLRTLRDIFPANHVLLRTLRDIFPSNHVLLRTLGDMLPANHVLLRTLRDMLPSNHVLLRTLRDMPRSEMRNYIFGFFVFYVIKYFVARHDALCCRSKHSDARQNASSFRVSTLSPVRVFNPAEESIVRKFTRPIWHRFLKGIKEYQLVDILK